MRMCLGLPGVVASYDKHKSYMLASKLVRERSVVRVGDVEIGGDRPVIMAGPCVVEDRESTIAIAREARANGAVMLRGGAYKPRTSPYAFQGLGEDGLEHLAAARDATGLPVVTEVMEPDQVDLVAAVCRHAAGRRPQHAELPAACAASGRASARCCSSAASRRRSRSG